MSNEQHLLGRAGSGNMIVPQSPHVSERHDHRSDPKYARFQIRLCGVIILLVVVLTTVSIATHNYGSSDDTPAPPPPGTPAFPPLPPGAWPAVSVKMTRGPIATANYTSYHYKMGGFRMIQAYDTFSGDVDRVLIDYVTGLGVIYFARGSHALCNVTTTFGTAPPNFNIFNATYLGGTDVLDGETAACDKWSGMVQPGEFAKQLVPVTYWQSRATGFPRRMQATNTPTEDYWFYDFHASSPPAGWYTPYTCPAGLAPLPPASPLPRFTL